MTEGYHYSIHATWRVQAASTANLGRRFLRTLDMIAEASPGIGPWLIGQRPFVETLVPIDEVRGKISQLVEDNRITVDWVDPPDYFYSLNAYTTQDSLPQSIVLSTGVGGKEGDGIRFEVGSLMVPSDLGTVTYPLFRAAMLAIIDQWSPVWANARLYWPDYFKEATTADIPLHPRTSFHMPWLSYLCEPLAKGLTPPHIVPCERTSDGGLLMIAAEERLDPTDPDHMRRSRAIVEVMLSRLGGDRPRPGWWPLDEEWPPSEETLRRRGPPPE